MSAAASACRDLCLAQLWREVQQQMFRLWLAADADMLASGGYRLMNTGQGLNRVQAAPRVSKEMSRVRL